MAAADIHQRHPTWSECPVCNRWFSSDAGFGAHMVSAVSRPCQDPAEITHGKKRLVPIAVDGFEVWRWQHGDTPPVFSAPPPRPPGPSLTDADPRG